MQKLQQGAAFVFQRKDSDIQHNADITSTELPVVWKCKDFGVERLQSELVQAKQKAVIDLEAEYARRCSATRLSSQKDLRPSLQYTACCAMGSCSSGTTYCSSPFPCVVIGRVCQQCPQPTITRRKTSLSRTKQHRDYVCEESEQRLQLSLDPEPVQNLARDSHADMRSKGPSPKPGLWDVQAFKPIFLNRMLKSPPDNNYWLIKDHHRQEEEEEARLVQEIHLNHEELNTDPCLVCLFDSLYVNCLEVRMEVMEEEMGQEEEMEIMVILRQMVSNRLGGIILHHYYSTLYTIRY